jgi:hypothetical protein
MSEAPVFPSGGSAADGGFSRRRLLGLSAAAGLAVAGVGLAGCAAAPAGAQADSAFAPAAMQVTAVRPPAGVIGTNINQYPAILSFPALQDVKATWVRAFFPMPDADGGKPSAQPIIKALLSASSRGYGTVLSLKFPYNDAAIPVKGSAAMATAERRLDAVLSAVMNKVDILVIGNEPFIECLPADRNSPRLNDFYQAMANRAIAYRAKHFGAGSKTQLFMGALNHLDQISWRTTATAQWMKFVRDTTPIAGTDIHPHLPDPAAGKAYLDYILPKMRPNQKFLATEFSLVLLYKAHLNDPVAASFASRYKLPKGTPAYQVIKDALAHPFPQQKWSDFLTSSPWFAANEDFLHNQAASFRATGRLAVASYGLGQGTPITAAEFTPQTTPWELVTMFCQRTVQPAKNGLPGQTTVWTNEFRALQG